MEGFVRTQNESNRMRCTHLLETIEGGTCQDTGKKATERGALTIWRPQREGLVRTWKESDQAKRTHILETAEGRTCQDMERK